MMRLSQPRWLGATLLSATLVMGCSHAPKRASMRPTYRPVQSVARAPVYTEGTAYVTSLPPVQKEVVEQPAPTPVQETELAAADSLPAAVPQAEEACEPITRPMAPSTDVPRRDFSDITARPGFRHNSDYTELVGEIQYLHTRECWRLRYASVDEEDRYGGSVTLVETGSMDRFKSGQLVRVIGLLVDADSRDPSPTYRVRSIKVLDLH